ncbi:hypothetical protein JQ600_09295 [Bradyrhizobium sp. AUGA SZCCT0176]|uniref:hypothetical protein n=1 Tax=Bradyrhizobium sp. AUGA SZCCT0176 TaxID=2807664 RepID=UPI001BA6308F|nr:hypothetical protein [Bradyrhizobium sp. AUGA SZCCT0176]MBR1225111.1 hypothetical protein [Bradyrhizobium sp. AUGA SZCCT0176]
MASSSQAAVTGAKTIYFDLVKAVALAVAPLPFVDQDREQQFHGREEAFCARNEVKSHL